MVEIEECYLASDVATSRSGWLGGPGYLGTWVPGPEEAPQIGTRGRGDVKTVLAAVCCPCLIAVVCSNCSRQSVHARVQFRIRIRVWLDEVEDVSRAEKGG